MTEINNKQLTDKQLDAFNDLPSIEPSVDWNERIIANLHQAKKSTSKLNSGLIIILTLIALLNGIILYSQLQQPNKTSSGQNSKYKVISQELFINPGSLNN